MSRLPTTLPLLLAAGAALSACSDRSSPSGPAVPAARELAPARESADTSGAVVVVGSGDPDVDVPAVQAAVDHGGTVVLKGHFSFDRPATKPVASVLSGVQPSAAEVLIAKSVSVSGAREEHGGMATIDRGTIPFYVDAPGQRVTIRGLRFVRPIADAILVYAVHGLEIATSRIDGIEPFGGLAQGIAVGPTGGIIPSPASPGNSENVSGTLRVVDNEIDMTPTATPSNTLGVTMFSLGVPGAGVDVRVAGNRIRNTTEPAINFRRIVGHAAIEHNVIRTGPLIGTAPRNQAIRIVNTGSYLVAHNSITCEWAVGDAEGIGVFSQFAHWPIEGAIVVDNDVTMTPPEGTVLNDFSAGIAVYGFANRNVVRHNTIRGRARAALAIPVFPLPPTAPAAPADNAFIRNSFLHFTPSLADIFVGEHALRTRIVGPGTVVDQGEGTTIER